jgi:hypothetical protein
MISYDFWQQYGADQSVIGRSLRLNGIVFTITGITPESFTGLDPLRSPKPLRSTRHGAAPHRRA